MSSLRRSLRAMPPAGRRAVGLVFMDVLRTHYPEADWTLETTQRNPTTTSREIGRSLAVEQNEGAILDRFAATEEDDRVDASGEQSSALSDPELRPEAA